MSKWHSQRTLYSYSSKTGQTRRFKEGLNFHQGYTVEMVLVSTLDRHQPLHLLAFWAHHRRHFRSQKTPWSLIVTNHHPWAGHLVWTRPTCSIHPSIWWSHHMSNAEHTQCTYSKPTSDMNSRSIYLHIRAYTKHTYTHTNTHIHIYVCVCVCMCVCVYVFEYYYYVGIVR